MINFKDMGKWHFVTEIDVVEVEASGDLVISVTAHDGAEVLNTTYTPVNGKVCVCGLARLLRPLITDTNATFTIKAGAEAKTVNVVQCAMRVSEGAGTFLPSFFLSNVMSERDTTMERKELLTLIATEDTAPSAKAECLYWNGIEVVSADKQMNATIATGVATEIDTSAKQFADTQLGRLVAYVVRVGARKMSYHVTEVDTSECAMLMRNNFGAWEAFYFNGMSEYKPEYTRDSAMTNGDLVANDIEESDIMKTWTGPLQPSGVALARDLARSIHVLLIEKGVATDAVTITATEVEHSTADDDMPDFSFSWRRADLWSAKLTAARTPKLFDDTFDNTYE